MAELADAGAPEAPGHPPGPRPERRGRGVARADPAGRVGVAGGRQQRGGPDQDVAARVAAEVHAQERQARVGNGIDEGAHQVAPLGAEPQVGAPEGHDPRVGVAAAGHRQAVRPQPGAEQRVSGADLAACRAELDPPAAGPDLGDLATRRHLGASFGDGSGGGSSHRG